MNYKTYLEYIEANINDLVTVQDHVKQVYDNLDNIDPLDVDLNVEIIREGLRDEKDILSGLMNNLNNLFGIRPSWHRRGFTIIPDKQDMYRIKHPRIDKSSTEYVLLRKLLIKSHNHYFLGDGAITYQLWDEEDYMWYIPNRIPNDKFISKLRRQIK